MDESGFDTLKATRALEAAGFASGQAEAMVTVFGGAIVANVATKWDIRDLKGDIRNLKGEIGSLRTELKRDIGALRTEFDAKLEQQIGTLRTELRSEIAEVRLSVESLKATMYKLLLAQAVVIVGLILGLQRFL
ncbi:MAG: hypothetical protein OXR05_16015 [Gemmatimonadota bacterium]|nr:hypothetical protein [Gemmatimonadota bacterium]